MLSVDLLKHDQVSAIKRLSTTKRTILIAPTGAGKTVMCLTAIKKLIDQGKLNRVIVACPAKVVGVWPKEVKKWSHLEGLSVLALQGSPAERGFLLLQQPDVLVVSLNSLEWLLKNIHHGADGIIVDELSKAAGKQAAGLRSKRTGGCFKWKVGMTATPVSQDFEKLYGMCRIIDGGRALGTNQQRYLEKYFYSDFMGYNWTLRDGADEQIMARVAPLVHVVEDTKEVDLPTLHRHVLRFDMPTETRALYDEMKRDMVAGDVEAANEAVKSGKLRQIASGFLYNDEGGVHPLNDKFDCARELAMQQWVLRLGTRKGVIFYEYKQQLEDIFQLVGMTADVSAFISGYGHYLLAQVNSLSHGVDGLQDVCSDALFYHPMWSRDATEQAIGRLWRQGQKHEVNITTLVCNDTLDDLVMERVEDRGEFMKMFMKHLKGK